MSETGRRPSQFYCLLGSVHFGGGGGAERSYWRSWGMLERLKDGVGGVSAGAVWLGVTNIAVLSLGTNDLLRTNIGGVYLPR